VQRFWFWQMQSAHVAFGESLDRGSSNASHLRWPLRVLGVQCCSQPWDVSLHSSVWARPWRPPATSTARHKLGSATWWLFAKLAVWNARHSMEHTFIIFIYVFHCFPITYVIGQSLRLDFNNMDGNTWQHMATITPVLPKFLAKDT